MSLFPCIFFNPVPFHYLAIILPVSGYERYLLSYKSDTCL